MTEREKETQRHRLDNKNRQAVNQMADAHTEEHALKKRESHLQLFSGRRLPPLLVLQGHQSRLRKILSFYSQMLLFNDLELIFFCSTMFDVFCDKISLVWVKFFVHNIDLK